MSKAKDFLYNSIIMTVTTVMMRAISVVFNVYISKRVGFAGIGLVELVMSVYSFAMIVATSGVSLAATRLVSEEIARQSPKGIRSAMSRCIVYSVIFGLGACFLLLSTAQSVAIHMLKDTRTIKSLYILAFSLPLISVQSALFGYFTAVRRVLKSAISQIMDQIVRIGLTLFCLRLLLPRGIEYACTGVAISSTLTEAFSFTLMIILYKMDLCKYGHEGRRPQHMTKRMLRISIPIALSTYAGSALASIKHIMIPLGLVKFGLSKEMALTSFGMIGGMVLPIITFPAAFLQAIAGLIVPEITESYELGDHKRIDRIAERAIKITMFFSIGMLGVFLTFANDFGMVIYKNISIGVYIRVLAPLILITYLDGVVDAMLKGIDKQVNSMFYNIIDSLFSIALVYILIPKYGVNGMLFVMFAGKLFNMLLSVNKIILETNFRFHFLEWIIKPLLASFVSVTSVKVILFLFGKVYISSVSMLILCILMSLVFYFMILRYMNCVTDSDLKHLQKVIKER